MIRGLFGPNTMVAFLRGELNDASALHRAIQGRVANAVTPGRSNDFASQLDQQLADGAEGEVDLQQQMVALADLQLKYDAASRLLRGVYMQYRTAMRDRA